MSKNESKVGRSRLKKRLRDFEMEDRRTSKHLEEII